MCELEHPRKTQRLREKERPRIECSTRAHFKAKKIRNQKKNNFQKVRRCKDIW